MNSDSDGLQGCIPNISPRERTKRLLIGILTFLFATLLLTILVILEADRWWRLVLFLPSWGAAIGFYQWRDKT